MMTGVLVAVQVTNTKFGRAENDGLVRWKDTYDLRILLYTFLREHLLGLDVLFHYEIEFEKVCWSLQSARITYRLREIFYHNTVKA